MNPAHCIGEVFSILKKKFPGLVVLQFLFPSLSAGAGSLELGNLQQEPKELLLFRNQLTGEASCILFVFSVSL